MKTRVSGVPYEVELPYGMDESSVIAELGQQPLTSLLISVIIASHLLVMTYKLLSEKT